MGRPLQSRMTSKGQVTVPAELRRELGLEPGDRVELVRENGSVQVRKAESIVDRLAGSVKAPPGMERWSWEEIREFTELEVAKDVLRRGRMINEK